MKKLARAESDFAGHSGIPLRSGVSTLLALFIFGLTSLMARSESDEILFSWIEPNDRIEISFHTSGCFHNSSHEIVLENRSGQYYATIQPKSAPEKARQIELSLFYLERMDQLLHFYRAPRGSGCTTTDVVQIKYFEDGAVIHREKFYDSSCSNNCPVTFQTLIKRAEKSQRSIEVATP